MITGTMVLFNNRITDGFGKVLAESGETGFVVRSMGKGFFAVESGNKQFLCKNSMMEVHPSNTVEEETTDESLMDSLFYGYTPRGMVPIYRS